MSQLIKESLAGCCHVIYVTCLVPKEQLYQIIAWMPRTGTVVIYGLATAPAV